MLIGYARVSTIDQNPALQMDALKTAGCDKVFTEKASGSHRDRPQLKAALNYLREGDTLVVWKLSRLARSLTQVIKTATDINDRGIALKVLTQNIDTSTSEGRLFFHMTAAFDEFQRELIVENTRAGLAAANKRGRRGGRPMRRRRIDFLRRYFMAVSLVNKLGRETRRYRGPVHTRVAPRWAWC